MEKAELVQAKDLCPVLTSRAKETQNVHALVVDKAAPKPAVVLIAKITLALPTIQGILVYQKRKGKRFFQVLLP